MIRVGFLRFEIEAADERVPGDSFSRQVRLLARPSYRHVDVKWCERSNAEQRFVQGEATYNEVMNQAPNAIKTTRIDLPDVGPLYWKYSESDRKMLNYWFKKIQTFSEDFAMRVVMTAVKYPQLVIANPVLRSNYARLVQHEVMRVIDGKSKPQPTIIDSAMEVDVTTHVTGVPELVAAELVRDVMAENHFKEFCAHNHVTIKNQGKKYRIPRRTHGLIDVWDEEGKPEARLCIVFKDPGLPPSDEVVMKYLLAIHDPKMLWEIANKFPPGTKLFEE